MTIPENLLHEIIYPLAIFILVIVLIVIIAELKRGHTERKIKLAELERQRAFKEKVEALRRRQEEDARKRAHVEEKVKEKIEKEKEEVAAKMEAERHEWEMAKRYAEMLSKAYFDLIEILPKESVYEVAKNHISKSGQPISISERGFIVDGFVSEERMYNFVLSLLKELGRRFGEPISNIALGELKQHIKHENLENISEKLKTLSLLELELKGISYLVEEAEPVKSYRIFSKLLGFGRGLCITRLPEDKIRERYGLNFEHLWLTKAKTPHSIDPVELEGLMQLLTSFLEEGRRIILLDGIEYLIIQNNYKTILKFIQSLNSTVIVKKSVLIIPVNPSALDPKELAFLEREMNVLKSF